MEMKIKSCLRGKIVKNLAYNGIGYLQGRKNAHSPYWGVTYDTSQEKWFVSIQPHNSVTKSLRPERSATELDAAIVASALYELSRPRTMAFQHGDTWYAVDWNASKFSIHRSKPKGFPVYKLQFTGRV